MIESLFTDVALCAALAPQEPGFPLVAIASLAIGIGFNTALFAIVDALLFRRCRSQQPDRLVDVFTSGASGTGRALQHLCTPTTWT